MAKPTTSFTQEYLKRILDYNPETGIFVWKDRPVTDFADGGHSAEHNCRKWNSLCAGKVAGTSQPIGYRVIIIQRTHQYAHRLAWVYVHGVWPVMIDHINGDKSDNRIANLRSVTRRENLKNSALRPSNTSGVSGVSWLKRRKRWQARIMVDNLQISLGVFHDFNDAVAARLEAEKRYGFHRNHGRQPVTASE